MKINLFQQWRRVVGEARTRILIWYTVLMALSMLVTIPAIRWLVFARIDARVRADLTSEVEIFRTKVTANFGRSTEALQQLSREQKVIALSSSRKNLAEVMEAYLSRQLPEDDSF